jgi:hypothetical protein
MMLDAMSGIDSTGAAEPLHLGAVLLHREVRAEAGDRLQLVHGAAGVAQPAPAHHGHRHAQAGDQRRQHDRNLVADAAGGVLVDLAARHAAEIHGDAGAEHHVHQRVQLRTGHAPEEDGHEEGRHLVLLHTARRVILEEGADLRRRQFLAIALAPHDPGGRHRVRLQPSAAENGACSPRVTAPQTWKISPIQS